MQKGKIQEVIILRLNQSVSNTTQLVRREVNSLRITDCKLLIRLDVYRLHRY